MSSQKFKSAFCALLFCGLVAGAAPLVSIGQKTYISTSAKLWTEPNRFGEATAQLKAGLPVDVLDYDASRSWILVRTPSGREGWVPLRFTSQDTRRTQPMISHKSATEDGDRSPAGSFEEAVVADAAGEKVETNEKSQSGHPFDFSAGYANQLSVDKAHGFSLGAEFNFEIDSSFYWGAGIGYKRFSNSPTGPCGGDTCKVSRASQRIYPNVQVEFHKDIFVFGANLGLAIDHTAITTTDLNTGTIVQTDDNGNPATGSDTEFRLGFGLRAGLSFPLAPGMAVGPYLDYDVDIALTDALTFSGLPAKKVFHLFGGGVLFQKVF